MSDKFVAIYVRDDSSMPYRKAIEMFDTIIKALEDKEVPIYRFKPCGIIAYVGGLSNRRTLVNLMSLRYSESDIVFDWGNFERFYHDYTDFASWVLREGIENDYGKVYDE